MAIKEQKRIIRRAGGRSSQIRERSESESRECGPFSQPRLKLRLLLRYAVLFGVPLWPCVGGVLCGKLKDTDAGNYEYGLSVLTSTSVVVDRIRNGQT